MSPPFVCSYCLMGQNLIKKYLFGSTKNIHSGLLINIRFYHTTVVYVLNIKR